MCYRINENPDTNETVERRGRKIDGVEKRCVACNVRLEPYVSHRLEQICKIFGINRSEAIRQGIMLYIKEAEKLVFEQST